MMTMTILITGNGGDGNGGDGNGGGQVVKSAYDDPPDNYDYDADCHYDNDCEYYDDVPTEERDKWDEERKPEIMI